MTPRLRYRIARWLLGYSPLRIPEGKPSLVVWNENGTSVVIVPNTFTLTNQTDMPDTSGSLDYLDLLPRRAGKFEGTF